jgi:hypothetical protein
MIDSPQKKELQNSLVQASLGLRDPKIDTLKEVGEEFRSTSVQERVKQTERVKSSVAISMRSGSLSNISVVVGFKYAYQNAKNLNKILDLKIQTFVLH